LTDYDIISIKGEMKTLSQREDPMNKILVSGLINIETTLKVDGFPVKYSPVNYPFWGIRSTVSGVAINISKALHTLGVETNLLSFIGEDGGGKEVLDELASNNIKTDYIVKDMEETPQSIILYEESGRRQIHLDLKDVQKREYPIEEFKKALAESSIAVLANINFSRPFLEIARAEGKLVATDVHVLSDIDDEYNKDFMRCANILFMSHEGIKGSVEDFAKEIIQKYQNDILVIGMGKKGALLYVKEDDFLGKFEAVDTREIINTIGAGDALFSSFIYFYNQTQDPYISLKKAILFASYKIGERGAAEGFLDEKSLNELYLKVYGE